jgi:hypothetical protein
MPLTTAATAIRSKEFQLEHEHEHEERLEPPPAFVSVQGSKITRVSTPQTTDH